MWKEKNTKPQAATNYTNHPDGFVYFVAPKVLSAMSFLAVMFVKIRVIRVEMDTCPNNHLVVRLRIIISFF